MCCLHFRNTIEIQGIGEYSVSAELPSRYGFKQMEDAHAQTEVTSNCSLGLLVTNFPLPEEKKARINQLIADKGLSRIS
jgi:hypothetical protein